MHVVVACTLHSAVPSARLGPGGGAALGRPGQAGWTVQPLPPAVHFKSRRVSDDASNLRRRAALDAGPRPTLPAGGAVTRVALADTRPSAHSHYTHTDLTPQPRALTQRGINI